MEPKEDPTLRLKVDILNAAAARFLGKHVISTYGPGGVMAGESASKGVFYAIVADRKKDPLVTAFGISEAEALQSLLGILKAE